MREKYFWKKVLLYSGQKGKAHNVNSEKQELPLFPVPISNNSTCSETRWLSLCSLIFPFSWWLQGTQLWCLFLTLLFVRFCLTSQAHLPQNPALRARLRQRVLPRSSAVIVIGTSTEFMKFPSKLWKRAGVLQNGCFS